MDYVICCTRQPNPSRFNTWPFAPAERVYMLQFLLYQAGRFGPHAASGLLFTDYPHARPMVSNFESSEAKVLPPRGTHSQSGPIMTSSHSSTDSSHSTVAERAYNPNGGHETDFWTR